MEPDDCPSLDEHLYALIRMAVREDLGDPAAPLHGDKTVELSIPPDLQAEGRIVVRATGVIAGTFLIQYIITQYGMPSDSSFSVHVRDGARVDPGQAIATFRGPARALLSAERVLLNFLGHLSGIATMTRRFVDAVAPVAQKNGGRPAICDTRKTTPAFRVLDKYAVRCGGGVNHRIGLYDGVMLKDNHLAALRQRLGEGGTGTLAQLAAGVRSGLEARIPLWLEVDTLDQLKEALHGDPAGRAGADIVLLDNFTADQMRQAVQLRDRAWLRSKLETRKSKILLEASGGITLDNVQAVAETGVDRISIGALTHSAPILDLSMEFQK